MNCFLIYFRGNDASFSNIKYVKNILEIEFEYI